MFLSSPFVFTHFDSFSAENMWMILYDDIGPAYDNDNEIHAYDIIRAG